MPFETRLNELEKRVGQLDGNSYDPKGGRVGRLESTFTRLMWLGLGTLLSTWGEMAYLLLSRKN